MSKFILFVLLLGIAPIITLSAQVEDDNSLHKKTVNNSQSKKKAGLVQRYTTSFTTTEGEIIPRTRVPEFEISGGGKFTILTLQSYLNQFERQCNVKEHIKDLDRAKEYLFYVSQRDKDWPVATYSAELKYYEEYEMKLIEEELRRAELARQRQVFIQDSVWTVREQREKARRIQDSLEIVRRDSVIRETTNEVYLKSNTLTPGTKTRTTNAKSEPSTSTPKTGRRYESHTYYTGPRGGCYYINADGKKVYVDRSLCN